MIPIVDLMSAVRRRMSSRRANSGRAMPFLA